MTFLAPWALAIGLAGAAAVVVLHLVARQRPAAFALPTTRFIPDQQSLVSRVATSPRDLLLLLLRVLLLLAAAAAFAQPVLSPSRGSVARVILLDKSGSVANVGEAVGRAIALTTTGAPSVIVAFDTSTEIVSRDALDSLRARRPSSIAGSISAALIAARRAAVSLADRADSIDLVLVSPIGKRELDAATPRLRALWPGGLRIERIDMRQDTAAKWSLEHQLSVNDALGPAMSGQRVSTERRMTRVLRSAPGVGDSSFAREGGTIVRWDSMPAVNPRAEALSAGGDVVVAAVGRAAAVPPGQVVARWADGDAAATEQLVGTGCLRTIGVSLPLAGDLPLDPAFRRIVRNLLRPCGMRDPDVPADSALVVRELDTRGGAASASAFRRSDASSTPLARWLLAIALGLAIAELALRRSGNLELA